MSNNNDFIIYTVLYTNQLKKKVPSYKDGSLKYNPNTKQIILCDEIGNKVESTYLGKAKNEEDGGILANIGVGEEFTTKSYKIQIESLSNSSSSNNNNNTTSGTVVDKSSSKPLIPTVQRKKRSTFKPPLREDFKQKISSAYGGSEDLNFENTNTSVDHSSKGSNNKRGNRLTNVYVDINELHRMEDEDNNNEEIMFGEIDTPATTTTFKTAKTLMTKPSSSKTNILNKTIQNDEEIDEEVEQHHFQHRNNINDNEEDTLMKIEEENISNFNQHHEDEGEDVDLQMFSMDNENDDFHQRKMSRLKKQQNEKGLYVPPTMDEDIHEEFSFAMNDEEIPTPVKQVPKRTVVSNVQQTNTNKPLVSNLQKTNIPSQTKKKPSLQLIDDDDDFGDGILSDQVINNNIKETNVREENRPAKTSLFTSASKVMKTNQNNSKKQNLDLSIDDLDVDSDEELSLATTSKPLSRSNSTKPTPQQPSFTPPSNRVQNNNNINNNTTPTNNSQPQKFVRPTKVSSSSTPPNFTPPSTTVNKPILTTPERTSPNSKKPSPGKKFKQTQLNIGKPSSSIVVNNYTHGKHENIPVLSLVQKSRRSKHELLFPDFEMNDLFEQNNTYPKRMVHVPDKFEGIDEYKHVFMDAIYEEMNLQLFNLAMSYYKSFRQITSSDERQSKRNDPTPLCKHNLQAKLVITKKEGKNKGRPFYACPKASKEESCGFFQWADGVHASQVTNSRNGFIRNITGERDRMNFFRSNGIHFYYSCEVMKQTFGSWKKKSQNAVTQWFLRVSDKESSAAYAKDDLWILSKSKDFQKSGNLVLAKSVFHGPDKEGKIEISIIHGLAENLEDESVYAIRGPNFSSDFEVIENLTTLDPIKLPLLYDIMGTMKIQKSITSSNNDNGQVSFELPNITSDEIKEIAKNFIKEYKLNEDQEDVIFRCAQWFEKGDISSPICLVHGVFGAGKTTLLIVVILFICRILEEAGDDKIRILVASVTNVAVDNILEGLVTENFKDVVRVGSQKKISKTILPYTVTTDNASVKDQIKQLKEMIKDEDISNEEQQSIKQAIKELQSGAYENRKQSVKDARVVGVTCAATAFEVLKNNKFSILILDESSQCLEPLALLPLTRFGCQKFIAVGDPMQLSPVLPGSRSGDDKPDSLAKTVFIRLSNIGIEPHLLRTQYRCHPSISYLSNALFYDNKLLDGITEDDRPPLIDGMPPVMVVDAVDGLEKSAPDGSYHNEYEMNVITHLVNTLIQVGMDHEEIGVICLYRSQATKLKTNFVKSNLKAVKVSTVDAFQGGEKNIIIVSTCRTTEYGFNFIEQKQRLNVALSRARNHLIVVGKADVLLKGKLWKIVIEHAKKEKGGIWSSTVVLANNDFDYLRKFKRTSINKAKRVMLNDDDEHALLNEDILSKPVTRSNKKEENEHLKKLSEISHKKHLIIDDDDEEEFKFEDDIMEEVDEMINEVENENELKRKRNENIPNNNNTKKSKFVLVDDENDNDGEEEFKFEEDNVTAEENRIIEEQLEHEEEPIIELQKETMNYPLQNETPEKPHMNFDTIQQQKQEEKVEEQKPEIIKPNYTNENNEDNLSLEELAFLDDLI
ncbi:hypothetical protein ABK040_015332 [Willaertia magna]